MPTPSPQADRPVCPPLAGPACPTRTPITRFMSGRLGPPAARPARHDPGTTAAEPGPPGHGPPASPPKLAGQIGWWVLVALGLLVPWWFNLRYLQTVAALGRRFFSGTQWPMPTTAITLDVYLAAVAFSAWVLGEARVRWPWLVVVCFGVGLSFALPLYLLLRRRRVD